MVRYIPLSLLPSVRIVRLRFSKTFVITCTRNFGIFSRSDLLIVIFFKDYLVAYSLRQRKTMFTKSRFLLPPTFSSSIERISSLPCHISGWISHKDQSLYSLFLTTFYRFVAPCLALGILHSLRESVGKEKSLMNYYKISNLLCNNE